MKKYSALVLQRIALLLWPIALGACNMQDSTTSSAEPKQPSPIVASPDTTNATPATPVASQPAEKDGLAVVIRPAKTTYHHGELLTFEITYHNTSNVPFRLPNKPTAVSTWLLTCTDVNTGKTYVGGTKNPIWGLSGPVSPGAAIAAGDTFATTTTFITFGFIEGDMDYSNFTITKGKMAAAALKTSPSVPEDYIPPLPVGTYKVSVHIQYLFKPDPDDNPVPIWKDHDILCNPVEITIAP